MRSVEFLARDVKKLLDAEYDYKTLRQLTGVDSESKGGDFHIRYNPMHIALIRAQEESEFNLENFPPRMPPVLMSYMTRGGVGKSTIAGNLSYALAAHGLRVLTIDCDPQANLTMMMGADPDDADLKTLVQLVLHQNPIYGAGRIALDEVAIQPYENMQLDLIPADVLLGEFDMAFANVTGREKIVAKWFDDNREELSSKYDVIVIDSAPGVSLLNLNLMIAASHLMIVMTMEGLALKSGKLLESRLLQMESLGCSRPPIRLVTNKVRMSQKESVKGYNYIKFNHGDEKFNAAIPDYIGFVKQGGIVGEAYLLLEKEFKGKAPDELLALSREVMQWTGLRGAGRYAK